MSDAAIRYELLIRSLVEAELQHQFPGVQVFRGRKYRGRASGHDYQIDVPFEVSIAGAQVLFLAERKRHEKRVGVDEVLEFASSCLSVDGAEGGVGARTGVLCDYMVGLGSRGRG